METIRQLKKIGAISLSFLLLACGAETVAAILFIPAFSAEWPVEGEEDRFIDLRNDDVDETVHSGTLTGTEIIDGSEFIENDIVGRFDGLEIEFTILRNNGNDPIMFMGEMIPISDDNHQIIRIELNAPGESLILQN